MPFLRKFIFVLAALHLCISTAFSQDIKSLYKIDKESISEWPAKTSEQLQKVQIQFNKNALRDLRRENIKEFEIQLLGGISYRVKSERIIEQLDGDWSMTAKIGNGVFNTFTLSQSNGKIYAAVRHTDSHQFYEIVFNKRSQIYELVKIDPHQDDDLSCGVDHLSVPPDVLQQSKKSDQSFLTIEAQETATIDVMVVYTSAARDWAESNVSGGIDNVINQAMARAQVSVDNSEVDLTFRLVYSSQVDYVEAEPTTDSTLDLYRLTASPLYNPWGPNARGYLDEVHYWREKYGADLVALFTLANDTGGIAWLPGGADMDDRLGFSLSRVQQAAGITHAHEMGHNMGNAHSRNQNSAEAGPEGGRMEYSTGWRWTGDDGNDYHSVMTYADGDTGVDIFSNPDINHQGVPTGSYDIENEFAPSDNAKSMNEIKSAIASYRPEAGTDIPYLTVSNQELFFDMGANKSVSKELIIGNDGFDDLTFEIVQGTSYSVNELTSVGGTFTRLNESPLSGSLGSIDGNFVLNNQVGETWALDLAILATESSEFSSANVVYQFGGYNSFAPSGSITYWQHGYSSEPGTAVHSTIHANEPILSDNLYLWVGNGRYSDTYSGTWTGEFNISGALESDHIDVSITTETGIITPGSNQSISVDINSGNLNAGEYKTNITIKSNDPIQQNLIIPITVNISESEPVVSVTYDKGWNLSGVPVQSEGLGYQQVFSNATEEPFIFTTSYETVTTLNSGDGFWVRLENDESVEFDGRLADMINLDLEANWNLVSGLGTSLPISAVEDPQNILSSGWYGFDGSYYSAVSIEPGRGYWIKASQTGSITLQKQATKHVESPPIATYQPVEEFNSLHFIEEQGDTLQTLYFGEELGRDVNRDRFVMPPISPEGTFDARFAGKGARLVESNSPAIQLQVPVDEKIRVAMGIASNRVPASDQYQLVQYIDGMAYQSDDLSENSIVPLYSPKVNSLELKYQGFKEPEMSEQPGQYALDQNYPNPFNPTTQISYQLPVSEDVRLEVYDMTGRRVATLVNREMSAGSHTVTFDASNLSSGVYMYLIQAGSFREVRRLTIIK